MNNRIMYIEHKSDQNDRSEAWIGEVEFSKSGQTLYFNNMAFKKMKGTHYAYSEYSNFYNIENDQSYWISGIKKDGQDRHYMGSGKIKIDKKLIAQYLTSCQL